MKLVYDFTMVHKGKKQRELWFEICEECFVSVESSN